MNDLIEFFKRASRKRNRGPVKTMCTYKGPAVKPTTTGTYYIQRTIPLTIIMGSQYTTTGPAVPQPLKPANDNI